MKDSAGLFSMLLLLVIGTSAAFGSTSKGSSSTSADPGVSWVSNENAVDVSPFQVGSKVKDAMYQPWVSNEVVGHEINLQDYRPIDPVPSSKASIRPGPVQHGTPLMPYIPHPQPPPPSQPKHGGHP